MGGGRCSRRSPCLLTRSVELLPRPPELALGFDLGKRLAVNLGEPAHMAGSAKAARLDTDGARGADGTELGVVVGLQALCDKSVRDATVDYVFAHGPWQADAVRLPEQIAAAFAGTPERDAEARGGVLYRVAAAAQPGGELRSAKAGVVTQEDDLGCCPWPAHDFA